MTKLLLTGSSGFVGKNLLPLLRERYCVVAPRRDELDLQQPEAVKRFLDKGQFDAVVHTANPTGHNPIDSRERLFEDSLRVFLSLERCADSYGRMIYFGSGAEFGKHRSLDMVSEEDIGLELPRDPYGLSRYAMQKLARARSNIVNLRLFGCYGPGDAAYKLIPDVMRCIREGTAIRLRQDAWFDFIYVTDIVPVLDHFLAQPARHVDYNLCSGTPLSVLAIAEEVRRQMKSNAPLVIQQEAPGLAYTASNSRLREEIPLWRPTPLERAVRNILEAEGIRESVTSSGH